MVTNLIQINLPYYVTPITFLYTYLYFILILPKCIPPNTILSSFA